MSVCLRLRLFILYIIEIIVVPYKGVVSYYHPRLRWLGYAIPIASYHLLLDSEVLMDRFKLLAV